MTFLKGLGYGLLALVGTVLLGLAVVWVALRTDWGSDRLRGVVLKTVNAAVAGGLEYQRLRLLGDRVVLEGVVLKDPEGEVVARVESIEIEAAFLALVRRDIRLEEVLIRAPELYLKADERGLNLNRAIAARAPPEPPKPGEPSAPPSLSFSVSRLSLERGTIEYLQEALDGGEPLKARVEAFSVQGHASYALGSGEVDAKLELRGDTRHPVRGPLALTVSASGDADKTLGELSANLPGLALAASARMEGSEAYGLEIRRLEVQPALVRSVVSTYPVAVPLSLKGTASLRGNVAEADLELAAGSAHLTAQGQVDIESMRARGLILRLRDANLAELVRGSPRSDLGLELKLDGGGTKLDTLDLTAFLKVPPSRIGGHPLGPVRMKALAQNGRFQIAELSALLPGVKLSAAGTGSERQVSFAGNLTVTDLKAFGDTLGRVATGQALPLEGSGSLDFSAEGPLDRPGLAVKGAFPRLVYQTVRLTGLEISAALPDVTKPLESKASVSVQELSTGGRSFQDILATLVTRGRGVELDLRTQGAAELLLQLRGTADADGRGLAISALNLRYPEALWGLQGPSHLRFAEGDLTLDPLTLVSGAQSIELAAALRGKRVKAGVGIRALDLALLPKAFVPAELALAGRLDLKARVDGTAAKPDIEAKVRLADGTFQDFQDLSLDLDAIYRGQRAKGSLGVGTSFTTLKADFDVPLQAVLRRRNEPVSIRATLSEFSLDEAARTAHTSLPLNGRMRAEVVVSGTGSEPRLAAVVDARELRTTGEAQKKIAPATASLKVGTDDAGILSATLEARTGEGGGPISVRTPWTLSRLLTRPPTVDELQRTPLEVRADVERLSLAPFVGDALVGTASLQGTVRGTMNAPTGELALGADGLQRGGSPAVSMKTVLSSSDERVSLTAKAEQAGRALLDASARIDAPVARLRTMEAVARTPVRIDAKVGPLSLADLRALTGAKGGSSQKLSAVLRGELEARGSLNAPELRVRADVDQLGMQGKALGEVHLRYAYERKRSDLAAALKSPGGELNLKALTTLDLAWPALRKGLAYRTAPVQATLTSRDFDVSVFNGFTEAVRSIEGKLSADASLTGTVGAPAFRGQLGFRDGRVALAGFGRYQDIELSLEGSNERVELKKLFARSGGGSALLTARADLDRGRFTVRGGGELKRFPIISEDQLVATVSVRTSFEGQGSDEVINISRLAIPEAQIELPDVKRRDLQELARADDIVLMRNGKAVNPKQRQALARARQAEARQEGTGGAGGVVPEEEDAAEPLRRTLIRVDAPRNIWVHGKDVNAEVGFSEGFRVEYGRELTMFGEIRVLRGRVDVYRRLDIQRDSTVRFMGPVMTPYISATAVHVNENEGVTIYLNVRGQGTDVTIRATSQPPMPESEIYTLLATGRRQLQRGSGTSSSGAAQATSILGSVIASQTKKVLDDKLPLDVISIEAGDQGLNDAKLEAGTYLTDKFYVGYTGTPFGPSVNPRENSNAVRLEYQLSPRWSAEFEYGDAPAGGLDLLWGKDY